MSWLSKQVYAHRFVPALALGAVLVACATKPTPETTTPEEDPLADVDLGDDEAAGKKPSKQPKPGDPDEVDAKTKAEAKKVMAKNRDRDPEVERRKMAASRKVSAKAVQALKGGDMPGAVKHAREALRVHEQNAEAMLVLAEVFYKQGKYELSLSVTTSVQSIDPKVLTKVDSSRAYNLKGFALLAMDKQTMATRAFRKAAETDVKNATAWNNLGAQYIRTGNTKSAIDCFAYATRLDSRFYKAHLNLGSAYRATRDWDKAEASFNQALRLRPNYPEAYFNLGVLYLDAQPYPKLSTEARLQKAIAHLSKYRELAVAAGGDQAATKIGDDVARVKKRRGKTKKVDPKKAKEAQVRRIGKELVSPAQADLYIELAQKGLDKERRRSEREQKRKDKAKSDAAKPTPENQPAPEQPAQKPGAQKPGAQKPGGKPAADSKPADKPASKPQEPKKPGAQASKPTQKPKSPQKPAQKPQSPQSPQKPGVQKPGSPKSKPAPQKPKVQRPGG